MKVQKQNTPCATVFCINCGTRVTPGTIYCSACGSKIHSTAQPHAVPARVTQTAETQPRSTGRHVFFWIVWAVLALLGTLMVLISFSVSMLIGFMILLVLPIVLRKFLTVKKLRLFVSWVAVFAAAFILVLLTFHQESSNASGTGTNTYISGSSTVTLLTGVVPEGETIDVKKEAAVFYPGNDDVLLVPYEISLPYGASMAGMAKIVLPYDNSFLSTGVTASDGVSAAYYDSETGAWSPSLYQLDEVKKTVTIYTDHFSKYAVVYFKDGRSSLSGTMPYFSSLHTDVYSEADLQKVFSELADGSGESPTAMNAALNVFSNYYDIPMEAWSQFTIEWETIKQILTDAGVNLAYEQYAFQVSLQNTARLDFALPEHSDYPFYQKFHELSALTHVFLKITAPSVGPALLEENYKKWYTLYKEYYQTTALRTEKTWFDIIKKLHEGSADEIDFNEKLDKELDSYCKRFWIDDKSDNGYLKVTDTTNGAFPLTGQYANGVRDISLQFKDDLYATIIRSVMAHYVDYYTIQMAVEADKSFNKLRTILDREYTVTVKLDNYEQVQDLSQTKVALETVDHVAVHSQSFDQNGETVLKMTLFSFLKTGCPVFVSVKVPAQEEAQAYSMLFNWLYDGIARSQTDILLIVQYVPPQPTPSPVTSPSPEQSPLPKPSPAPSPTPNPSPTPKPGYNYTAAVAAWAADYAAQQRNKTFDDGTCKTTCDFEWVVTPFLKNGQVYGAHRLYYNDTYYAGPKAGTSARYVATEMYDASNPGSYISADALKKAYPQFGS